MGYPDLTVQQGSFAAGEVAPEFFGRVDQLRYQLGLRTNRNMLVMKSGGLQNRSGTHFCDETRYPSKRVKPIPFIFSSDPNQSYFVELGDLYAEFIQAGGRVVDVTQTITAITKANPPVVTYIGADPANGDDVIITGGDMPEIVNRRFRIKNVNAGANTYELTYTDNTNVDSTSFTAYTAGASFSRIYKIVTTYLEADLQEIQGKQSGDVIRLTHNNYPTKDLSRFAHTNWTLSTVMFKPTISPSGILVAVAGGAGALTFKYRVYAVDLNTFEHSVAIGGPQQIANAITQANPGAVTMAAPHLLQTGDMVRFRNIQNNMKELNERDFRVTVTGATTFTIDGEDTSSYGAYTPADAEVYALQVTLLAAAAPTGAAPHVVSFGTATDRVLEYRVFKESNGAYGLIGVTGLISFNDTGIVADMSEQPTVFRNPFYKLGKYPGVFAFFQDRAFYGAPPDGLESVVSSQAGFRNNLCYSYPIQATDSFIVNFTGQQVNAIRHILDLGELVVLTAGGEWVVTGDQAGTLKPDAKSPLQKSYYGSSKVAPVVAGRTIVFIQARGGQVRAFSLDDADSRTRDDLSIWSRHLLKNYTITDMAWQQNPESIVWMVRSDGALLGLTYVREHEMVAWARHDTDGIVENVCVIPEGNVDALYMVVKRTNSGPGPTTRRYVERMNSRLFIEANIAYQSFMDAGLQYNGWNAGATTITLTTATGGWTPDDELSLTASVGMFYPSDVGKEVHLKLATGEILKCKILYLLGGTPAVTARAHPDRNVPVAFQGAVFLTWAMAVRTVTGLWHLNGKYVSILGDGNVVASPNNPLYPKVQVVNGAITFPGEARHAAVIQLGLPYVSDVETLNIDTVQGETLIDKKKLIKQLNLLLDMTRGGFYGQAFPDGTDAAEGMIKGLLEIKARNDEDWNELTRLLSGPADIDIEADWNSNGRVVIRQVDPLPISILKIAPAGAIPLR